MKAAKAERDRMNGTKVDDKGIERPACSYGRSDLEVFSPRPTGLQPNPTDGIHDGTPQAEVRFSIQFQLVKAS